MKKSNDILEIRKGAIYEIPTYIMAENGIEDRPSLQLKFFKGSNKYPEKFRQEGVFLDSLLKVCKMYLEAMNDGELASGECSTAITKLDEALILIRKEVMTSKKYEPAT